MKKAHTKIVFFDHASPKPAATSMLLYTTEEDLEKDGKESPLKSIPDDVDLVKIEDVKEEAIEETMGHEAPDIRTTSPTPVRDAKSDNTANTVNAIDSGAFNTFEPKRESIVKEPLVSVPIQKEMLSKSPQP